ncbi:hypothetical protein CSC78_18805 [Pseudoxanthomonas japonensis]|uniref:Uncharacterized protein n=1 Tax=Pseudoxanthomonas japonensis TaxID=69284 RepID=A0ABQ6ZC68_9GAMM|nr:hypothetical protein CSC78_18805 [Pseudoxanthomonas japonensis]
MGAVTLFAERIGEEALQALAIEVEQILFLGDLVHGMDSARDHFGRGEEVRDFKKHLTDTLHILQQYS